MTKNTAALFPLAFGIIGHCMYISGGVSLPLLVNSSICYGVGAVCIVAYKAWPFGIKSVAGRTLYVLLAPPLVPIMFIGIFLFGLIMWLWMFVEVQEAINRRP